MGYAYYTMASEEFVPGAVCLIKSLKRTSSHPIKVISLDLSDKSIEQLESLGAVCEQVRRIGSEKAVPKPWHCTPEFANNCFNKLYLWDSGYDKVIYLDADCLVLKNIDHLFELQCDIAAGPSFAVTQDKSGKKTNAFYSGTKFQAGVLVIRPDASVFDDLIDQKDKVYCPDDPSDQGFLNHYYSGKWHRLEPIYNATRRVYMVARDIWDQMSNNIHVIHYTLEEPWLKSVPGCEEIEKLWWECYKS